MGVPADEDIPARRIYTKAIRTRIQNSSKSFLTGTWDMDWLAEANKANALWLAINLLRLSTMRESESFQMGATKTAQELEMDRKTLYRHLKALENVGLVKVTRRPKVWPKVRLLGSPRYVRQNTP